MGKEQSLEEMVLRKLDIYVQKNGVRPLLLFSRSVVLTLRDPEHCSTPGFLVIHYLLELAQIHVH